MNDVIAYYDNIVWMLLSKQRQGTTLISNVDIVTTTRHHFDIGLWYRNNDEAPRWYRTLISKQQQPTETMLSRVSWQRTGIKLISYFDIETTTRHHFDIELWYRNNDETPLWYHRSRWISYKNVTNRLISWVCLVLSNFDIVKNGLWYRNNDEACFYCYRANITLISKHHLLLSTLLSSKYYVVIETKKTW